VIWCFGPSEIGETCAFFGMWYGPALRWKRGMGAGTPLFCFSTEVGCCREEALAFGPVVGRKLLRGACATLVGTV
jgi:hypothetical protein